jgi:hypothetical protein
MAKKKFDQGGKAVATVKVDPPQTPIPKFPELSPKTELECRVLLEDQILLVDVRLIGAASSSALEAFLTCY